MCVFVFPWEDMLFFFVLKVVFECFYIITNVFKNVHNTADCKRPVKLLSDSTLMNLNMLEKFAYLRRVSGARVAVFSRFRFNEVVRAASIPSSVVMTPVRIPTPRARDLPLPLPRTGTGGGSTSDSFSELDSSSSSSSS